MYSKRLLCIVNVLPFCPLFNLTVFQQKDCISAPPHPSRAYFCFGFGRACGTRFVSESAKTHFPPSLEGLSISAFLSAQSLPVLSDVPRAFSAHFKRYNLFPR